MKKNEVGEAHPISSEDLEVISKEQIIKFINDYWRFDNNQQHLSSWHDKQDLIEKIQSVEPASSIEDKSAGVWVKASERLPDKKGYYITRRPTLVGERWLVKEATFNPKYDDTYIHQWKNLDIEWLDESKQASPISEEDKKE